MSRRHTFSKAERLLKPEEFRSALERGRRLSTRSFRVCIAENGLGRNRLGVSISAKVAPSVKRSGIKRLVREFFRLNKERLSRGAGGGEGAGAARKTGAEAARRQGAAPEKASLDILISVKRTDYINTLEDVEDELLPLLTGRPKGG